MLTARELLQQMHASQEAQAEDKRRRLQAQAPGLSRPQTNH